MSSSSIQIVLNPGAGDYWHYKLCGLIVSINQPVKALSAFQYTQSVEIESQPGTLRVNKPHCTDRLFAGLSWLAGQKRHIECWCCHDGFVIRIPDAADFHISKSGTSIRQLNEISGRFSAEAFEYFKISTAGFEQILLGPPLMLSMALRNYFGFHASAVRIENKAILFVGDSGFGKSTLAKWLAAQTDIQRLSDDISVVDFTNGHYQLFSDFPQMKLKDECQQTKLDATPIAAIAVLKRDQSNTAQLSKLNQLDSFQSLIKHSVAAQLFDKSLASKHLQYLSRLSHDLPVYELAYASGEQNITAIADLLRQQPN